MIQAIEVEAISKILTCDEDSEILDALLSYSPDNYFVEYNNEIKYIHKYKADYGCIPTVFNFMSAFPEFTVVAAPQPIDYFIKRLKEYRQSIMLVETFNKIKDLGEEDAKTAWAYISAQCEKAESLDSSNPLDIVKESEKRAEQIKEYSKQKRIPTGFDEIDKVMYGGLSTVEELLVIIARSNAGKSWTCTKMMESAQKHGFAVAYYSPEMQAAYLGTRFDTWRGHFENSKLFTGDYSNEYYAYLHSLKNEETSAYVIEDKDAPDGVSVKYLDMFVKKHGIKLLIIDGISYMQDDERSNRVQDRYKNIAQGLFKISKRHGCAVVLVMQANREVKSKDDKGESIPTLYNAEDSDQPCRIATQAFGIRQIFDKHVLDIALLKARMANNTNPVFSYAWDINTGQAQYIPGDATLNSINSGTSAAPAPQVQITPPSVSFGNVQPDSSALSLIDDDEDLSVEF